MLQRPTVKIDATKILQILAIYLFALIAAVACSPNFAAKPGSSPSAQPASPAGPVAPAGASGGTPTSNGPANAPSDTGTSPSANGSDFKPSIKSATVAKTSAGAITIEYVIDDAGRAVTIKTSHSKAKPSDYVESPAGAIGYAVNDVCADEACSDVVAAVDRIQGHGDDDSQVEQSTFALSLTDGSLRVTKTTHQTSFDDINDAFKTMKPAP